MFSVLMNYFGSYGNTLHGTFLKDSCWKVKGCCFLMTKLLNRRQWRKTNKQTWTSPQGGNDGQIDDGGMSQRETEGWSNGTWRRVWYAVLRSALLSFHSLNVQRSAVIYGRPWGVCERVCVCMQMCVRQTDSECEGLHVTPFCSKCHVACH